MTMNKSTLMTVGAVGFAAFALWYAFKKPAASTGTGVTAYDVSKGNRQAVGGNTWQNNAVLSYVYPEVQA